MGPFAHFFSNVLFTPQRLAFRWGMTSSLSTSRALYLSARCLRAEDNLGELPRRTLITWTIFTCCGCCFRAEWKRPRETHTRCVGSASSLSVCFSFDLDTIQVCLMSFRCVWYISWSVLLFHISSAVSHTFIGSFSAAVSLHPSFRS